MGKFITAIFLTGAVLLADQITLNNGDRVTGKIVSTNDKILTVKTDLMGEVKMDRSAITAIQSDAPLNVTLKSGQRVQGTLATTDSRLAVQPAGQPAVTARLDEVAAIRDDASQRAFEREQVRLTNPPFNDFWSGSASFALASTSGNARTQSWNTSAAANRATGKDKLGFYFNQVYATQSTTEPTGATASRVSGGARYDRNLGSRAFGFATTDFDHDRFQKLDLRSVLGSGLGYHAWASGDGDLNLSLGGAWSREKFSTGLLRNSTEALAGQEFGYKLLKKIKLSERLMFYPNLSDVGNYRIGFDLTASIPVMKYLEWGIGVNDRYLSNPLEGLKSNDILISTAIRFTFDQSKR